VTLGGYELGAFVLGAGLATTITALALRRPRAAREPLRLELVVRVHGPQCDCRSCDAQRALHTL